MKISGTFSVKLNPQENYATGVDGIKLARMSIDKSFEGALSAISQGEMLSALARVNDAAGYVAIEQVTGLLEGKSGSFVLQHFGIMDAGRERLILEVLPGSGSGDLAGISGTMHIRIEDGQHYYEFDYTL